MIEVENECIRLSQMLDLQIGSQLRYCCTKNDVLGCEQFLQQQQKTSLVACLFVCCCCCDGDEGGKESVKRDLGSKYSESCVRVR